MSRLENALRYYNERSEASRLRETTGIELNRKGDAEITVSVPDGQPLPTEITLEVEQKNHEFRFGANLFMLDELETPEKKRHIPPEIPRALQSRYHPVLLEYS